MHKETYHKYRKHWVASDIHFNHKNISLYCPESRGKFVKTVGQNVDGSPIYEHYIDKMNVEIIRKWNEVVSPEDHVFILGDVAMGRIDQAPALIRQLNGDKTLIRGNHDRSLMGSTELETLFIDIKDYACFSARGVGVVMSHYPFASWDGMGHGAVMLHGHLHGTPCMVQGRIKDVGIDTNDLYPYDFEQLLERMKLIPKPVYDHHGDAVAG
jgi:calcineurin-like phosphoesterase family protein